MQVTVIGAGLAGCEAAWQLAQRGIAVTLHEMKPEKATPAHHTADFAELCCSNSLRSDQIENAVGLLKEELRRLDSLILACADATRVEAGGALAVDRYGLMERFVADYVRENPADGEMEGSNTTLAWIEFLRANGIEHAYATGSIAEVLADVNDRVSGQTQQLANSVGWSKDLIAMQLQQDSMRLEVGARLDSLERNFTRIVVVAEHLPEISDKVLEELNKQVTQLIYTMNYSLDNAFANFDRQRDELQRYVTAERQALVDQLRESADGVVQRTLDAVPGLVGKVLLYVVLALVVLIGGPFALGFWLGGVRERGRRKREKGA